MTEPSDARNRFLELQQRYEEPEQSAFFIRANVDARDSEAAARQHASVQQAELRITHVVQVCARYCTFLSGMLATVATVASISSDASMWKWLAAVSAITCFLGLCSC
jgi:hypothetical protein